eukprot:2270057-Amphidinium_carterae.1
MHYRGMVFKVPISSMEEHAQLTVASFVKGLAVEAGTLVGLPGELAVVPKGTQSTSSAAVQKKWTVARDALVEYIAGRELASTLCSPKFTGSEVTTMLKKRET